MTSENGFKSKIIKIKIGTKKTFATPVYNGDENYFLNEIATMLIQGIEIIIFDTYNITPQTAYSIGIKIKQLCAEFNTTFLLKGKIDIAFVLRPDAFILDKDNLDIHQTKEILGDDLLIGYWGDFNCNEKLIHPDFIINGHAISEGILNYETLETDDFTQKLILQ